MSAQNQSAEARASAIRRLPIASPNATTTMSDRSGSSVDSRSRRRARSRAGNRGVAPGRRAASCGVGGPGALVPIRRPRLGGPGDNPFGLERDIRPHPRTSPAKCLERRICRVGELSRNRRRRPGRVQRMDWCGKLVSSLRRMKPIFPQECSNKLAVDHRGRRGFALVDIKPRTLITCHRAL
jgi:hypothetical protein